MSRCAEQCIVSLQHWFFFFSILIFEGSYKFDFLWHRKVSFLCQHRMILQAVCSCLKENLWNQECIFKLNILCCVISFTIFYIVAKCTQALYLESVGYVCIYSVTRVTAGALTYTSSVSWVLLCELVKEVLPVLLPAFTLVSQGIFTQFDFK